MTAILLIIGAAVVGPIYAQRKPVGCPKKYSDLLAAHKDAAQVYRDNRAWTPHDYATEYSREPETLEELCQRTLREIGASYPAWTDKPPNIGDFVGLLGPFPYTQNGIQARCIPVPSGYQRSVG